MNDDTRARWRWNRMSGMRILIYDTSPDSERAIINDNFDAKKKQKTQADGRRVTWVEQAARTAKEAVRKGDNIYVMTDEKIISKGQRVMGRELYSNQWELTKRQTWVPLPKRPSERDTPMLKSWRASPPTPPRRESKDCLGLSNPVNGWVS